MNPDIRVDKFAITGEPDQFSFVIPALDYWIRSKNLWILGFPRGVHYERIEGLWTCESDNDALERFCIMKLGSIFPIRISGP